MNYYCVNLFRSTFGSILKISHPNQTTIICGSTMDQTIRVPFSMQFPVLRIHLRRTSPIRRQDVICTSRLQQTNGITNITGSIQLMNPFIRVRIIRRCFTQELLNRE